ncbi:MAG: P-II family nitrogen regulator [Desulfomicrobium sp.]|jgi:nitrogen regulatory protein P-II 1|nr:P-II family nitrogen regulator [Pseudomonadota bacterium]MBV1712781.1 P-II family nitrogen regulator [Desulfomicrobium sp.]MBU4571751.1 P-II family nitrogen regulator [Pseudomonadota bacterium]MBU4595900.1 P-II family nitrogen regulator [Pseudomonadota bacterium]MBV1721204.1 P-II family nitrogen regulator [Desulfomicrobium sp.]
MKRVEIITRPYKLDEIKEALTGIGIQGMTVTDVRGFGRQRGHKEVYRGAEYQVDFVSKVKIEVVIDEDLLDQTLEVIQTAAKTGKIGDGKIFISTIDNAIRIRTGESGGSAL